VSGGGLTSDAGRIESLDALAVKFMGAEDKAAVMGETVAASADLAKYVISRETKHEFSLVHLK
jgi:hypothetical protein